MKTTEPDECSLTLVVPQNKKRIIPLLIIGVACFGILVFALSHGNRSMILPPAMMIGGFGALAIVIRDFTLRQTLMVDRGSLTYRLQTIFNHDEQLFTDIREITLARYVKGHGIAPITLAFARKESKTTGSHLKFTGLGLLTQNRLQYIPLAIPAESILVLAETIQQKLFNPENEHATVVSAV
ncbi:MAG: hypothetical protein A2498_06180 [Lentisphaerae bacterium RIFOXYC12_FULL_60_16]|nr:MAG: hypothetical protein A2498_06180 [Lentisphaerae bacterium RIFOXYC12_FULL_60_16]